MPLLYGNIQKETNTETETAADYDFMRFSDRQPPEVVNIFH